MFFQGLANEKNDKKAREWVLKAAESGLVVAQYNLAQFYLKGIGGEKSEAQAKLWLEKAVKQGDSQSEQLLHLIQVREIGNQQFEINLENIPEKTHPFQESENSQKSELLHEPEWLLSKNKDHYAIQVIALNSSDKIKRFVDQHAYQADWAYFAKQKNKKKIYVLIRCCFDSKADAQKENKNLPVELKKINPFLVKLDYIQNAIKEGLK